MDKRKVSQMHNTISMIFQKALTNGWKIVNCSCTCGGRYAWQTPDNRMYGCICHTELPRIDEMIPDFIEKEEVVI